MDIGKPHEYLETNKIVLDSQVKKPENENPETFRSKKPSCLRQRRFIGEKSVIGPIRHIR